MTLPVCRDHGPSCANTASLDAEFEPLDPLHTDPGEASREEHEVATRPATPEDGTKAPGALALYCSCGWSTVVITDPQRAAELATNKHLADPDHKTVYYEIWMRP